MFISTFKVLRKLTQGCENISGSQIQFLYVVIFNTCQRIGRVPQIDEMNEFGYEIQNLTDVVALCLGKAQIQLSEGFELAAFRRLKWP